MFFNATLLHMDSEFSILNDLFRARLKPRAILCVMHLNRCYGDMEAIWPITTSDCPRGERCRRYIFVANSECNEIDARAADIENSDNILRSWNPFWLEFRFSCIHVFVNNTNIHGFILHVPRLKFDEEDVGDIRFQIEAKPATPFQCMVL